MITKKKWDNLLETMPNNLFNTALALTSQIDTLFSSKLGEGYSESNLSSLLGEVVNTYLKPNSIWKDLPVYMSSYKVGDKRVWNILNQKLLEYCGFYKKLLTDDGISRRLVTANNFSNSRTGNNENNNIASTTPQYTGLYNASEGKISSTAFEEAIGNFASDLTKSNSTTSQSDSGTSGTTITGASWEETLKNVKMVYFNELVDFIANIPNMIYVYYSLETMPVPALVVAYLKNVKESFEIEKNE